MVLFAYACQNEMCKPNAQLAGTDLFLFVSEPTKKISRTFFAKIKKATSGEVSDLLSPRSSPETWKQKKSAQLLNRLKSFSCPQTKEKVCKMFGNCPIEKLIIKKQKRLGGRKKCQHIILYLVKDKRKD